jgi:DNA adenine methylase
MRRLKTPIKRHGGKAYMAREIVALMPPRRSKAKPGGWFHYVEPYFGGGSVLLANDPSGISEVVNDVDKHLTLFWRVLQNEGLFDQFHRRVEATPFSESTFAEATLELSSPTATVKTAWAFFVLARQSMGGKMDAFAPVAKRIRRQMNDGVSHWLSTIDRLPELHARLRRVLILDRDALDVIRQQDSPGTLFYLDPPYLHATREKHSRDAYRHEMTDADHEAMLKLVLGCAGKVMISGYQNPLYGEKLRQWRRRDFDKPNHAAGGREKRRMVESVWMNF